MNTAPSVTIKKTSAVIVSVTLASAALFTLALLRFSDRPREAALMAGIFVLAALLWVTEAMPLFATSLLVIGLQVLLLANPGGWPGIGFASKVGPGYRDVLAAAADPILLIFFGGFLLARRSQGRCGPGNVGFVVAAVWWVAQGSVAWPDVGDRALFHVDE